MDSTEGDRNPVSASATTSPPVQESPFFRFASRLPPINSVKAAQHVTRFSETIFPSTPPVFKSPQPDPLHKNSYLKRDEGLSSPPDGKSAVTFHVYEQGISELQLRPIACSEKDIQSGVPSGCVDDNLTDPADVGITDSAEVYVQSNGDASQLLESGFPGSNASKKNFNDRNYGVQPKILPDLAEKHLPSSSSFIQNFSETCNEYVEFLSKCDEDHPESDTISEHLEEGQTVKVQNAGSKHNEYGGNRVRMSCTVSSRPVPDGFSKFAHTQRGICRHLQFEGGRDPGRSTSHSKINSSNAGIPLPFTSSQAIRTSALQTPFFQNEQDKSSRIPSGVLMPGRSDNISEDLSVISLSTIGGDIDVDNYDHNNDQPFSVSTGVIDAVNCDQISSFNSFPLSCFNQLDRPCEGTMTAPQNAERFEELRQNSPKRNRRLSTKRTRSASKTGGSKTCNCKRSKCLKLYCECFSAGVFCGDSCACDNCFNKPENEDAITQKRKDIKLRCPEAFAPKVLKNIADSPAHALEDGHGTTPSSARHKRGCNCKKSKCSKKYCECFQANVGCCDGCRCENCENSFGKKPDLMFYKTEIWNKLLSEKLDSSDGIGTEILADISNIMTPLPNPQSQSEATFTHDRSSLEWKDEEGRRFVLQTVPSFPPLSPYSNTNDRTYQISEINDFDSHS